MPGFGGPPDLTDEQREQMRQQMQSMTDEERQAMRGSFGSTAGRSTGQQTGRRTEAVSGQSTPDLSGSSSNNYYEGATLVTVKTGQYNENYMEITEGLKEGDIVVLPMQTSNGSTGTRGQPTGGFGIPGGGMFGGSSIPGGIPGGGSFTGGGGRR